MLNSAALFASLPVTLRDELIACYQEIVRNYLERRWEPAELNGGKFCEVVYTILDGATSGTFANSARKPARMVDACRALEGKPAVATRVGDRSLRVLLPRLLPFLYEIRNNRGVGHVGGDVDPNHEDAEAVLAMASWVMAELVRIFHKVSLSDAQAAVESLVQKRHPLVWSVEGIKRVLNPTMSKSTQTLVLLYSEPGWVQTDTLCKWVEYSSLAMYRTRILRPLHQRRFVEHDADQGRVRITPAGVQLAEGELLPT
jgi:hypothetical protein